MVIRCIWTRFEGALRRGWGGGVLRSCWRVRFFDIGGTGSFDVVGGASTLLEAVLRRGWRGRLDVIGCSASM